MTISPAERARRSDSRSVFLQDGATLAVVGGGPAGAFFAILAARKARALGKALDLVIIERFLELPHIKRLIPRGARLRPACLCFPNMTVKRSRGFLGDRIALVGDIVVSRLYKDGIFSAYTTAEALSDCILNEGIGRSALMRGYAPFIRRFDRDNRFGEVVFALSRLTFSRPVLSRIVYQAVLTELKSRARERRRLGNVLWKIASGDDSYRKILGAMAQPAAIWTIFWGGALMTFRNALTERLFGLRWEGIGRYQTGVAKEDFEEKRQSLLRALEVSSLQRSFWRLFRLFFPGFVHDVIWNHTLCRLKHLVEANPE